MSKHRDYRGAGVASGVLSISRQARVAADANRATLWVSTVLTVLVTLLTAFSAQARSAPESFADLAARLLPSVVNISTTQTVSGNAGPQMPHVPPGSPFEEFFKEFFDRNWQAPQRKRRVTSLGSGFIIDAAKGYVVTNNHVIADADEITVILHDDTRLAAKLVGRDQKTDLAVLRVEHGDLKLKPSAFGDSDAIRVGDWVIAIGNPFGLGGSVTAGIVSARGRDIHSGNYDDFIQTDASINRGNSGGPLFNLKGEVVGINTAIYTPSGGSVGIGFSIPTAMAKPVIDQLIKHGKVRRGWLGVQIQQVTDEIAETLGLDHATGALVAAVTEDGPAQDAGIEVGDVILTFNGKTVEKMRKLPRIVAETDVGKSVSVEVWRARKKVVVTAKLGALDETEKKMAAANGGQAEGVKPNEREVESLGLTLSTVTPDIRRAFNIGKDAKGVVVTAVKDDGNAAEKGIRPGDLVVEVNQEDVGTPGQVLERIRDAEKRGRKSVLLLLDRQGGPRYVAVKISKN